MEQTLRPLDNGGQKEELSAYKRYKYEGSQDYPRGREGPPSEGETPLSPDGDPTVSRSGPLLSPACRSSLTSEEEEFTTTLKSIKQEDGVCARPRASLGPCKVCGDEATGMYFGALVCVPCKTFFLRYAGDNFAFVCKHVKNCEITMTTRTQCKYCRYQKCLQAGMCRRERPAQVQLSEGQQLCVVCKDIANGVHFGAITCEGCKKFFRRGLTEHNTYSCKNDEKCLINPRTRNSCRYCRFKKCIEAGMSREAIQMGRPSKIKHSNSTDNEPSESKMPRLDLESISLSMAREVAGSLQGPRDNVLRPAVPSPPDGRDMSSGQAMRHHAPHSQLSPPVRLPSQATTSQLVIPEGLRTLYDGTKIAQTSSTMSHSPQSPQHSFYPAGNERPDSFMLSHDPETPRYAQSPQSDSQSVSPLQSDLNPMSTPVTNPQPRLNPVPFNLFPIPSPGSDVRFHGPIGPRTVEPDSVNAAHLIEQIISQSTKESSPSPARSSTVESHTLAVSSDSHTASPGDSVRGHGLIESVAPAMPMARAFQNIKQEFARVALSMYPPVTQIKSSSVTSSAPTPSINRSTSESMPSPDTTGVASPSCTITSASNALAKLPASTSGSSGQMYETLNTTVARVCNSSTSRQKDPQPVSSNSVLSSLFELSEHLQGLRESPGTSRVKVEKVDSLEESEPADQAHQCLLPLSEGNAGQNEFDFKMCVNYWLRPELPDENLLFSEDHWRIIDQIMPAYNRFVETGSSINRKLTNEVKNWYEVHKEEKIPQEWINAKVVPVYTLSSVTFSRDLPEFNMFEIADQCTLVRLGQSQSRILVAAVHWYDPDLRDFRDFLSWRKVEQGRPDFFKRQLVEYARVVHSLELDNIEAGLLNVLVIVAKDYPGLKKPELIEQARSKILLTFRAYTTAKYGTPNRRIETLFSHIPELRQLGFMHHRMTLELQLKAEECIDGQR